MRHLPSKNKPRCYPQQPRNLSRNLPGTRGSEPSPEPSRNPWFGSRPVFCLNSYYGACFESFYSDLISWPQIGSIKNTGYLLPTPGTLKPTIALNGWMDVRWSSCSHWSRHGKLRSHWRNRWHLKVKEPWNPWIFVADPMGWKSPFKNDHFFCPSIEH